MCLETPGVQVVHVEEVLDCITTERQDVFFADTGTQPVLARMVFRTSVLCLNGLSLHHLQSRRMHIEVRRFTAWACAALCIKPIEPL